MAKVFMPDVSQEERINIMRNNADKIDETTYDKELTQDAVDIKRETLVDNLIAISSHEEVLDSAKAVFKQLANPLKEKNAVLQREVKYKREVVKGVLFHMANHDEGVMEVFDQEGELVSSRRLLPTERRQTIPFIPKAVAGE